ncbi:hypothetical protein CONLIGDRAFT_632945 [Coniochaeta ligniaria NRRL 30616]|uniref:FAR1 domain-containing protein n=1 Tax=Coniochaeta ligniaria NRRL 30616 TaxID=1408157 RepID=A0A1J7IMB3_9PEZI|nr:hypothetical protein CONLIGDRAFT_632945 [Coniochaeta ligniaria NRRL 30616]
MSAPAPRAMLPPPEERLYASFQDAHEDLKKWTLSQGYALSIDASSNRDASGMYRRYNMSCVKGGKVYKPTAQGKRRSYSKKTGCPMKIKCTKQDGWPWNGRWRVTVICGDHNHTPFDPDSPDEIPPAFRHVEGEGLRWLLIMHREAQLNLRQLTIGLRATFGDKYKFIKKADVSNMLSKVKREEERELANRPPGAPPLPPGTMTAFMAALLNPVPDPYANGVRYELVPAEWPTVPGYQSATTIQQQQQQQQNPQQQQPLPQGPPQYTQQAFQPHPYAQYQQMQGPPPNYGPPQHYMGPQQPPQAHPAYPPQTSPPGQQLRWKIYGPPPPAPPTQPQPPAAVPHQAQGQQAPPQPQMQQNQQQGQQPPQQQPPPQHQQQQVQAQQPPPQQQQQPPPPQQQAPQQQGQRPAAQGPPAVPSQMPPYMAQQTPEQRPGAGGKSMYRSTTTVQPVPVAGVPGAVVMPRSFSPVSEDESDDPEGYVHDEEEEAEEAEDDEDGDAGDGDADDD